MDRRSPGVRRARARCPVRQVPRGSSERCRTTNEAAPRAFRLPCTTREIRALLALCQTGQVAVGVAFLSRRREGEAPVRTSLEARARDRGARAVGAPANATPGFPGECDVATVSSSCSTTATFVLAVSRSAGWRASGGPVGWRPKRDRKVGVECECLPVGGMVQRFG
jgi:hypothetical protein